MPRRRPLLLVIALLAATASLAAEPPAWTLFPRGRPAGLFLEAAGEPAESWSLFSGSERAFAPALSGFRSVPSPAGPRHSASADLPPSHASLPSPATHRVFDARTTLAASGALASVATVSYVTWWSGASRPFHFRSEGFFGRGTYSGGLDKASHLFFSYMLLEPAEQLYRWLGHPATESRLLGAGTLLASGLIVEAGDGFGTGASWQDFVADVAGALTAFALRETNLDDTVGFRAGWLPTQSTPGVYRRGAVDVDYSQEIYSADVKLGGLFRKLRLSPGVARFFLLSLTYDTKGYSTATVPTRSRERNIGVALGLCVPEIARALGLREDTWWSRPLYAILTYFRFPYTAFGFRYDLNHRRWQGPDTGDRYHPAAAP